MRKLFKIPESQIPDTEIEIIDDALKVIITTGMIGYYVSTGCYPLAALTAVFDLTLIKDGINHFIENSYLAENPIQSAKNELSTFFKDLKETKKTNVEGRPGDMNVEKFLMRLNNP